MLEQVTPTFRYDSLLVQRKDDEEYKGPTPLREDRRPERAPAREEKRDEQRREDRRDERKDDRSSTDKGD